MAPIRAAFLVAVFGAAACTERPMDTESTEPPDDVGVAGDPTEIEGSEIGENVDDNARAVEPGPAELEVGEPQEYPGAHPN
jgi:hypothetical protein